MSQYFVYISGRAGSAGYVRTFTCTPSEIFRQALSDYTIRNKLLHDMYMGDPGQASVYHTKYANGEQEPTTHMLRELQSRLEMGVAGYCLCSLGALNAGVAIP